MWGSFLIAFQTHRDLARLPSNGRNICISYKTRGANLRFKEEGSIVLVGSIFAASVLDW